LGLSASEYWYLQNVCRRKILRGGQPLEKGGYYEGLFLVFLVGKRSMSLVDTIKKEPANWCWLLLKVKGIDEAKDGPNQQQFAVCSAIPKSCQMLHVNSPVYPLEEGRDRYEASDLSRSMMYPSASFVFVDKMVSIPAWQQSAREATPNAAAGK